MSLRNLAATAATFAQQRADLTSRHDADIPTLNADIESHEGSASQPLLRHDDHASQLLSKQHYGAAGRISSQAEGSHSQRMSPELYRREGGLNRVPEEMGEIGEGGDDSDAESVLEWDLEERGLYAGSYRRVLAMYSVVPVTSLLTLFFLALAPSLFWRLQDPHTAPHPPYYPTPVPEMLLSSALWSFAYLLRFPLYSAVSTLLNAFTPFLTDMVFNVSHAVVFNLLRLSSLPILGIGQQMRYSRPSWHDPIFRSVWWLSLGWATIDVIVGIVQSYSQISLYRNVMVPEDKLADIVDAESGRDSRTNFLSSSEEALPLSPRRELPAEDGCTIKNKKPSPAGANTPKSLDEIIRLAVDKDLEQLVNLKEREDLEEIYGFPVIRIPVFVSCLQRVDSILLSTGNTLVLAAAYLLSQLSIHLSDASAHPRNNRPFYVAFSLVLLMNVTMSLLHTPYILPRIGVHTTAYIGFLLGLGSFFAGLGLWGALA